MGEIQAKKRGGGRKEKSMQTHTRSLSEVPWAGRLRCVGWDYLCDWISEEGLPQDSAVHLLNTAVAAAAAGVCLTEGRSRWS